MTELPTSVVSEAALSREQLMLRELFRDHFALADRFDAAASQVTAVELSLHGTAGQQGIAGLLLDAAGQLRSAATAISNINLDALIKSIEGLNRQIALMPERLLKPADEIQFRASLREALGEELADALTDARTQIDQAGRDAASKDLAIQINTAMSKAGESAAAYFAERNQLRGLLESEKAKSAALSDRLHYFETDKAAHDKEVLLSFASKYQVSAKQRLRDFAAGTVLGAVLSLGFLTPPVTQYINNQLMTNPR